MQSKDELGKRPKSRPSAFVDILDERTKVAKSLLFFVAAKPIHLDKKWCLLLFHHFSTFFAIWYRIWSSRGFLLHLTFRFPTFYRYHFSGSIALLGSFLPLTKSIFLSKIYPYSISFSLHFDSFLSHTHEHAHTCPAPTHSIILDT